MVKVFEWVEVGIERVAMVKVFEGVAMVKVFERVAMVKVLFKRVFERVVRG